MRNVFDVWIGGLVVGKGFGSWQGLEGLGGGVSGGVLGGGIGYWGVGGIG